MRRKTWLLLFGLLVVGVVGYRWWTHQGSPDWREQASPEQKRAFAEIENQGGRVRPEETTDGRQGITVAFNGPRVTDAELASLRGLTQLHTLYIHDTHVTGAGLAHLEGQSQLQTLSLLDS